MSQEWTSSVIFRAFVKVIVRQPASIASAISRVALESAALTKMKCLPVRGAPL